MTVTAPDRLVWSGGDLDITPPGEDGPAFGDLLAAALAPPDPATAPFADLIAAAYAEQLHPRDSKGRFAHKPGGPAPGPAAWHGPKDPEGRWITDAVRELDINTAGKRTVYYRKNFVDITKNSGYRVTLHPATPRQEIRHYDRAEDAAEALRRGEMVDSGTGSSEGLGTQPPPPPPPGGLVPSRAHYVGTAEAGAVTDRLNQQFPGDYIAKLGHARKESVPVGKVYALGNHHLRAEQVAYLEGELRQGHRVGMPVLYREGDRYYIYEGDSPDHLDEEKISAALAAGKKSIQAAVITGASPGRAYANLRAAVDKEAGTPGLPGQVENDLGRAQDAMVEWKFDDAATAIRDAAVASYWTRADRDRLNRLALRLNQYGRRDEIAADQAGRAEKQALEKKLAGFAQRGADAAAAIYGTPSGYEGRVYTGSFSYAGAAGWDGSIDLDIRYAKGIVAAFEGGPVERPRDLEVLFHEETHMVGRSHVAEGQRGHVPVDDMADYKTGQGTAIEEGFTELGSWWELPEWLDRTGLADVKVRGAGATGQTLAAWAGNMAAQVRTSSADYPYGVVYGNYVEAAARWTQGIATREGLRPGTTAAMYRMRQLAREVNAESGPGKRFVMARQLLEALGIPEDLWDRSAVDGGTGGVTLLEHMAEHLAGAWEGLLGTGDPAGKPAAHARQVVQGMRKGMGGG